MLSKIKNNALSLATAGVVAIAAVAYLTMGVAVTSGNGWSGGPSVTHAAVPTPTVSPTPCTTDDPTKPCPTPSPSVTPMPTPSPTMEP
ncbi:MAG: hypothetical protein IT174_12590 [Acidobacteria bacterium]|nr:hypothetical protein [Acidobacteriota bacterium]